MELKSYQTHAFFGQLLAFGFETITAAATAIGFTAGKLSETGQHKTVRAFLTIEGADIRYRLDGTDPTASVGHRAYDGGVVIVEGETNLANFKMIAVSGSATVSVSYSRYER